MIEDELVQIISPPKPRESIQCETDYKYIHNELQYPGVILTLLWEKYVAQCKSVNKFLLQYIQVL